MLKNTLLEVVCEQPIKWAKCWVLNMIQLEVQSIDICIAIGKGSDVVIILQV